MLRTVKVCDLKVGDVVRYNGNHDIMGFGGMMVTEVDKKANIPHLIVTRPYLILCEESVCERNGRTEIRPHIGLEPVWFSLDSSFLFDVMSENNIRIIPESTCAFDY